MGIVCGCFASGWIPVVSDWRFSTKYRELDEEFLTFMRDYAKYRYGDTRYDPKGAQIQHTIAELAAFHHVRDARRAWEEKNRKEIEESKKNPVI